MQEWLLVANQMIIAKLKGAEHRPLGRKSND